MKSKGSFIDAVEAHMKDGMKGLSEGLMGRHYISRIPIPPPNLMLVYEVAQDFSYNHIGQDIYHGVYHFKSGEIIALNAETNQMYFMPDRSDLKLLGRWYAEAAQKIPKKDDWRILITKV